MKALARAAGAGLAILMGAALVGLSDVEMAAEPGTAGLLRLSWRAVAEQIEECRAPSEAELQALPPHMRPTEVCEGRLAPFQLAVRVDGETRIDRPVHPAGARGDRPAYVFEELRLDPGRHQLEVAFRVAEPTAAPTPPLELRAPILVRPHRVVLVTRDADTGRLVAIGAPSELPATTRPADR